jgi:hypothetical protein
LDPVVHGDDLSDDRVPVLLLSGDRGSCFAVVPYTSLVEGEPVSTSEIIRRVEGQ